MKISGVSIRPGNIIEYEGGIWRAVKIQHTQPGKGGAYMQVELKNLIDGRKNNVRFRSAETVERVRLDTTDFQFLFADGDMLTFMDKATYEQISLPRDLMTARPDCYDDHRGVDTPGSSLAQFNSAYSNGGLDCVARSASLLTGLEIDHAALMTWNGVIEITNAIGGVEV